MNNNADISKLTAKLVRDSKLLSDTFMGLSVINKASDGDIMVKFHDGSGVAIHNKRDTVALLERQRDDLIDAITSKLRRLDHRPIVVDAT